MDFLGKFQAFNSELSIWSIACSQHVYACYKDFYDSVHQKVPTTVGQTVKNVVESYVLNDKKSIVFDSQGLSLIHI